MTFMDTLLPALAAVVITFALGCVRARTRAENQVRTRQLQEAADLLATHSRALNSFLSSKEAPLSLKKLLIETSDALNDQKVALKVASWMSSKSMRDFENEDAPSVEEALREIVRLRETRPSLAKHFDRAILTVAVGSVLRWPESAALFEQIGTRIVAIPEKEINIAVTAATSRTNGLFALADPAPAMA